MVKISYLIKNPSRFLKLMLSVVVAVALIFSGWPLGINRVEATTVLLTTGTTWVVPTDWNSANNTIEVIGGGGGGGGGKAGNGNGSGSGGGGGAYAKISNLSLTAGGSVTIQVGAGGSGGGQGVNGTAGTATWFNGTTCAGASVCGDFGSNGLQTSGTGGAGGAAANSVGTTIFDGGSGGGGSTSNGSAGGGGGGAAGLNGAGTAASAGPSAGGSGDAGLGGAGGAAGNPGAAGGNGTEFDATHGSGGGGGGGNLKSGTTPGGGAGGLYGAGGGGGAGHTAGGNGNQGLIVITYTPAAASSTFTQNTYRWYQDNDALNPATAWGDPALAQNTAIPTLPAGEAPPTPSVELRLRVNLTVGTANLAASAVQFKLQFKAGTDGLCTTGAWTDVGASQAWQYGTSSVTDGSTIVTTLLTTSNVGGQYAKSAPTALNANAATTTQNIEYDFHIIGASSASVTQYNFRVVKSDGTVLSAYTNCPTLTTAPATENLMRHGKFFENQAKKGFFWAN